MLWAVPSEAGSDYHPPSCSRPEPAFADPAPHTHHLDRRPCKEGCHARRECILGQPRRPAVWDLLYRHGSGSTCPGSRRPGPSRVTDGRPYAPCIVLWARKACTALRTCQGRGHTRGSWPCSLYPSGDVRPCILTVKA
eukprot:366551-Chlamydomonas_euryale.AAC.22